MLRREPMAHPPSLAGHVLPFPAHSWGAEFFLVWVLLPLEASRLFFGMQGNLTEQTRPLVLFVLFTVASFMVYLFFLLWQTYVYGRGGRGALAAAGSPSAHGPPGARRLRAEAIMAIIALVLEGAGFVGALALFPRFSRHRRRAAGGSGQ